MTAISIKILFLRTKLTDEPMKLLISVLILSLASLGYASEEVLPKECLGYYAGEMPAYTVVKNDIEMNIDRHDVRIQITRTEVFYSSGTIKLSGAYTFLKESGNQFLIKVNLSNGKNISYQLDLIWYKKTKSLLMSGKNGEPDVKMEKVESI